MVRTLHRQSVATVSFGIVRICPHSLVIVPIAGPIRVVCIAVVHEILVFNSIYVSFSIAVDMSSHHTRVVNYWSGRWRR